LKGFIVSFDSRLDVIRHVLTPALQLEGHEKSPLRAKPIEVAGLADPAFPACSASAAVDYGVPPVKLDPAQAANTFPGVGKLKFTWEGGVYYGTAFVVSQSGLVTAGHNLYDWIEDPVTHVKRASWSGGITYISPSGKSYPCTVAYILEGWAENREAFLAADPTYDVAMLTAQGNPGDEGIVSVGHNFASIDMPSQMLRVMGYPLTETGKPPIDGRTFTGQDFWAQEFTKRDATSSTALVCGGFALTTGVSGGPFYGEGVRPNGWTPDDAYGPLVVGNMSTFLTYAASPTQCIRVARSPVWGVNLANLMDAQLQDDAHVSGVPAPFTGVVYTVDASVRYMLAINFRGPNDPLHVWVRPDGLSGYSLFQFNFFVDPATNAMAVDIKSLDPRMSAAPWIGIDARGDVRHLSERSVWNVTLAGPCSATLVKCYLSTGAVYLTVGDRGQVVTQVIKSEVAGAPTQVSSEKSVSVTPDTTWVFYKRPFTP
jgi:hypothetical protein